MRLGLGFELFVQGEQMHFRPPTEGEVLELQWLSNLESFRVRVASAEQVRAVEVRGWDYRRQSNQEIVARMPKSDSTSSAQFLPSSSTSSSTGSSIVSSVFSSVDGSQATPPSTVITATEFGAGAQAAQLGDNTPDPQLLVVDKPVFSNEEAEQLATALWQEVGGEFVQADARAPGDPAIRVGKVVDLTNMGRYSGRYYVTEISPSLSGRDVYNRV